MLALLIALASPAGEIADLSWMAGHWLECSKNGESAETWTDGRGGVMLGLSKSVRDGRTDWELSRVESTADGMTFFASPKGQQPATFKALSIATDRAVFENSEHDFPQRVIYVRDGDRLTGRIEGDVAGKLKSMEWHYQRATLNTACPRNPE
jgi:hypothetical protein